MKISINADGYVENFVMIGDCPPEALEVDMPVGFDFETYKAYKYVDGVLSLDEDKLAEIQSEAVKEALRIQRESECFPIINRGELWYQSLTSAQITELSEWYNAWLDVTETMTVPEALSWVK